MGQGFDPRKWEREMRAAQRKAEAAAKREVDRVNRENKRRVDEHNRKVERENKRRVDEHNRKVAQHNRRVEQEHKKAVDGYNKDVDRVNRHNAGVIADLNRRLRVAESGPSYTVDEQALADRVQGAVAALDDREYGAFLSYARIDGAEVGDELRGQLENLGVSVWFDEVAIRPGHSQSRQMDLGLQKARAGIALLTPAYLTGRFWVERELGALLHKETLIPVLHGVTFAEVAEYSGILPDLAGFETSRDSVELIAQKIAAAVLGDFQQAA